LLFLSISACICTGSVAGGTVESTDSPEPPTDEPSAEPTEETGQDIRFGYDEQQRFQIYSDMVQAYYRAVIEAWDLYPTPDPTSSDYTPEALTEARQNQDAYIDEHGELYRQQVANDWGLTIDQLHEIELEGIEKEWPLPPPPIS
jgi:hypothetical protein